MTSPQAPLFSRALTLRFVALVTATGLFSIALTLGGIYLYFRNTLTVETDRLAQSLLHEFQSLDQRMRIHTAVFQEQRENWRGEPPPGLQLFLKQEGIAFLGSRTRAQWQTEGIPADVLDRAFGESQGTGYARDGDGGLLFLGSAASPSDRPEEMRSLFAIRLDEAWLNALPLTANGEVALCDEALNVIVGTFPLPPGVGRSLKGVDEQNLMEIDGEPYGLRFFPYAGGGAALPCFAVLYPAGPLQTLAFRLGGLQLAGYLLAFAALFFLFIPVIRRTTRDLSQLAEWAEHRAPGAAGDPPPPGRFHEIRLLSDTFVDLVTRLDESLRALGSRKAQLESQVLQKTQQILEHHHMLQDILGGMPQAVILLDGNGIVVFANAVAARDFGVQPGRPLTTKLLKALGKPSRETGEAELTLEEREFVATRHRIGGMERTLLIVRDVTVRKAMEQSLLQTQRIESVSRLAGGVAHEFNNALASILPGVEVLRMRVTDEKALSYVDAIEGAALRGADVVQKLLTFSRASEVVAHPLDLNATVETALALLRPTAKSRTLFWEPGEELPFVLGDEKQFQQVVLNLGLNALDAIGEAGEIRLQTWADPAGDWVHLAISDTGPGVPPEVAKQIFDPFFTTKQPGQGTGLGLSIAFAVVESYGGRLRLVPQPEGSRFEVDLPVPRPPSPDKTRPGASEDDIVIGA